MAVPLREQSKKVELSNPATTVKFDRSNLGADLFRLTALSDKPRSLILRKSLDQSLLLCAVVKSGIGPVSCGPNVVRAVFSVTNSVRPSKY
jgi:hypothetical protein